VIGPGLVGEDPEAQGRVENFSTPPHPPGHVPGDVGGCKELAELSSVGQRRERHTQC
jgi:hypothetical protein